MNKVYIKYITFLSLIALSISLYRPFSIKAEYGMDISALGPYVGYNIYPVQIIEDMEIQQSLSSSSSSISGSISNVNLIQYTSSGVTGVSSTRPNGNGGTFTGSMTLNLSATNTKQYLRKGLYCFNLVLDNYYIGEVTITLEQGSTTLISNKHFYVNGNELNINFVVDGQVTNTSANDLILTIGQDLTINYNNIWQFPIESMSAVNQAFNQGNELYTNGFISSYIYPAFKLENNNKYLFNLQLAANNNGQGIYIFAYNFGGNPTQIMNRTYFDWNTNITMSKAELIDIGNSQNYRMYKLTFTNNTSSNQYINFKYIGNQTDKWYVPIFLGYERNGVVSNISTDFALNFNLSNPLLDSIYKIADGNSSSNDSVSTADSINTQANTTFDTEEQLVNNAEQDLSTNLQSLDIANKNNNLFGNSKFIDSAQWVKTQFDYFTNNNAFGYLITFSLVIGISLVIIGKLRG